MAALNLADGLELGCLGVDGPDERPALIEAVARLA